MIETRPLSVISHPLSSKEENLYAQGDSHVMATCNFYVTFFLKAEQSNCPKKRGGDADVLNLEENYKWFPSRYQGWRGR